MIITRNHMIALLVCLSILLVSCYGLTDNATRPQGYCCRQVGNWVDPELCRNHGGVCCTDSANGRPVQPANNQNRHCGQHCWGAICYDESTGPLPDSAYEGQFIVWQTQYGKSYDTIQEYKYRLSVFRHMVDIINQFDASNSTMTLGLNAHSDQDPLDYKRGLAASARTSPIGKASTDPYTGTVYGDGIDWRQQNAVTPVKDEYEAGNSCGSCWVMGAMGTAEGRWAVMNGKPAISFSEQYIMDCRQDKAPSSCENGGYPTDALDVMVNDGGAPSYDSYPYVAIDQACQPFSSDMYTVDEWNQIDYNVISHDDTSFMQAALQSQPIACAVDASSDQWQLYSGGIFDTGYCHTDSTDHVITIVGYDTTSDGTNYWIVKNSWGETWGMNGYMYLPSDNNPCGCTVNAFTAGPTNWN